MEAFAQFYVDIVEPALKALLFFVVVMACMWFIRVIKDPSRQMDMASQFFQSIINFVIKAFTLLFTGIVATFSLLSRSVRVIIATVRDFFTSRI